ncbi:2-hydroxy-3-oxopropionate reductase [Enterococcus sp. 669A]|uniref:2-hydroxy-3-oxopropionate reductase n=1 Tax=Candidatus Enterococcus moelleringii TaxID=2815325 RepID=A0ABS3LB39_9ENTE|nr:2-hydroxy-3-oxopropionate reductase [Enterococcus sp. 669A]MBO1306836.1 2-hydroxy-3-oxopropionate reductase [Enterococcus sp. 669A]
MTQKIGFVGLGIMGKPMAKNLIQADFEVSVFDLNEIAVNDLVAQGAKKNTVGAMAQTVDFIITMLPTMASIKETFEQHIFKNASNGLVVINMSSIGPSDAIALAEKGKKMGVKVLDAPVSGGEPKAIDGTLSIMVGGEENAFNKSLSVFQAIGQDIVLLGSAGSGSVVKLANQIIVNLNIAAVSEALVLAAKANIDLDKMYHAIRGGLAGSVVLDAKVPLILDRNFKPGGAISINLKDLTNVMETAHDLDVPLPMSSQLLEIFHALKADGKATDDHCGIVQYYEKLANITVSR